MRSFEKSIINDLLETDCLDEDDSYCVKVGTFIPGGCEQEYCNDITECPYLKQSVELN